MDKLDNYRVIVGRLIEEYASYKPAYGDIRTEAIVDVSTITSADGKTKRRCRFFLAEISLCRR